MSKTEYECCKRVVKINYVSSGTDGWYSLLFPMFILDTNSSLHLCFVHPSLWYEQRFVTSFFLRNAQLRAYSCHLCNCLKTTTTWAHQNTHAHIVRQLTDIITNRLFWGMYRLKDGEYSIVPCGHTAANRAWLYINACVSQLFRTKPKCQPRKTFCGHRGITTI